MRYAVAIPSVREITRPLQLIEVAKAPTGLAGLADYRDQVLAVVDLREHFGFEGKPAAKRAKWIVAKWEDRLVAFIVDSVSDVFSSEGQSPRQVPPSQVERGIAHAYKQADELVFVIDLARFCEPLKVLRVPRTDSRDLGR